MDFQIKRNGIRGGSNIELSNLWGITNIKGIQKVPNVLLRASHGLALFLILVSVNSAAQVSGAGIPEAEFVMRMEAHILRVRALAEHLLTDEKFLKEFPEYRSVNKRKFISAILEHDAPKVVTDPSKLSKMGISNNGKNPFVRELAKSFGASVRNASGSTVGRFKSSKIISDLNVAEDSDAQTVKSEKHFTKKEGRLFKRFEIMVDKYDRYMENFVKDSSKTSQAVSRITGNYPLAFSPEFNRSVTSPGKYLEASLHGKSPDPQLFKMVKFAETHVKYAKVTHGLDFESYKQRRASSQYKIKSFDKVKHKLTPTKSTGVAIVKSTAKKVGTEVVKGGLKVVPLVGAGLTAYEIGDRIHSWKTQVHQIKSLKCSYDEKSQKVTAINTEFDTQQGTFTYPMSAKIYLDEKGEFRSVYSKDENFGMGHFFVDLEQGRPAKVRSGPERYRLSSIPLHLLEGVSEFDITQYKLAQVLTNFSKSDTPKQLKRCCQNRNALSCLSDGEKSSGSDGSGQIGSLISAP